MTNQLLWNSLMMNVGWMFDLYMYELILIDSFEHFCYRWIYVVNYVNTLWQIYYYELINDKYLMNAWFAYGWIDIDSSICVNGWIDVNRCIDLNGLICVNG